MCKIIQCCIFWQWTRFLQCLNLINLCFDLINENVSKHLASKNTTCNKQQLKHSAVYSILSFKYATVLSLPIKKNYMVQLIRIYDMAFKYLIGIFDPLNCYKISLIYIEWKTCRFTLVTFYARCVFRSYKCRV